MNVLFLNEFDDKAPFIKELSENLAEKNIEVDILDLKKHRLIKYSSTNGNYAVEETVSNTMLRSIIRFRAINVLFKLIYYNWFYTFSSYDHISYHYVGSVYLFFNRKLTRRGKIQSSAILWGSDFYRSSFLDNKLKRALYRRVNFIGIGNPIMKNDFLLKNPENKEKVRRVVFGIEKLKNITELQSNSNQQELRKKWEITDGKVVVTIGYNGRRQQQHLRILETLRGSLEGYSDKVHVVIPYGYLGNEAYRKEITQELDNMGLSYTIVDWYCSDEEVAEYRIISDVVINGQTTDALSASIQEHFFAGGILLTGQWLPYEYFKELGLHFSSFAWDTLQERFSSIMENLKKEKESAIRNKEIVWSHSAWSSVIEGWADLYSNK